MTELDCLVSIIGGTARNEPCDRPQAGSQLQASVIGAVVPRGG